MKLIPELIELLEKLKKNEDARVDICEGLSFGLICRGTSVCMSCPLLTEDTIEALIKELKETQDA